MGGSFRTGMKKILFAAFYVPKRNVPHTHTPSTCPAGVPALSEAFKRRLAAMTSPRPRPTPEDVAIKLTKQLSYATRANGRPRPEVYRFSHYHVKTVGALLKRAWFNVSSSDGSEHGHESGYGDIMELFKSAAAARAAARTFANDKIDNSKWTEVVEPAPKRRRR